MWMPAEYILYFRTRILFKRDYFINYLNVLYFLLFLLFIYLFYRCCILQCFVCLFVSSKKGNIFPVAAFFHTSSSCHELERFFIPQKSTHHLHVSCCTLVVYFVVVARCWNNFYVRFVRMPFLTNYRIFSFISRESLFHFCE